MAQRRMFSKGVTESDPFLDMPLSTQALYFHLGMQADDDGFVSPNRIIRMIGSNPDDLKVLLAKGFLIPFESGVLVITHWKESNYIQKDRYKPTLHIKEKSLLLENDKGIYFMDTNCIQNVRLGKVRLGKSSQVKESLYNANLFETLWNKYPKKDGKKQALKHFKVSVKTEQHEKDIDKALDNYINHITKNKIEYQFIKNGATWFNNWEDWIENPITEIKKVKPETEAEYYARLEKEAK